MIQRRSIVLISSAAIESSGADCASSMVSRGRIGLFVRRRAIERNCGRARSRASSTVGATDAFTVRKVSGVGCASLGWYSVR
jgi:hypothetical protein